MALPSQSLERASIYFKVIENRLGKDREASKSNHLFKPGKRQANVHLLLLLPLLTGFLFGTALKKLLGKFLGFRGISKVGSDVIMDLVWRFHFLQERNKRGNCNTRGRRWTMREMCADVWVSVQKTDFGLFFQIFDNLAAMEYSSSC